MQPFLAAIEGLNPVSYTRIDQPGTGENLGFIAQQVAQVFPSLVSTTSATALTPDGTLTLNYQGLIAPIVKVVQTVASEVAALQETIAGFAQSFTSDKITTKQFCAEKSDGSNVCITGDQLAAILAATGQSAGSQTSNSNPTLSTTTPPTITLSGANPATISVGATYNDLGATATDNQGHSLTLAYFLNGVSVPSITLDTTQVATDTIEYVATDTWGNTATSSRTVVVEQ